VDASAPANIEGCQALSVAEIYREGSLNTSSPDKTDL
jgi:hypothetical protein